MRALVTGGASGIGAATVSLLRAAGHEVMVWDKSPGADVVVDVSSADEVTDAMTRTLATGGPPQLVVAAAGVGHSGQLTNISPDDWQRVMAVNLTGVWLTLRAAAGALIDEDLPGSMVAVTSISGSLVDRDMGAYCASKAGADMVVKVAAAEWGVHGIRVNAVGPGVTRTPMLAAADRLPGWIDGLGERTALGRLGEPGDVAGAVLGVLTMEWVTGQVLYADGGLSLHSPIDAYGQVQRLRKAGGVEQGRSRPGA